MLKAFEKIDRSLVLKYTLGYFCIIKTGHQKIKIILEKRFEVFVKQVLQNRI